MKKRDLILIAIIAIVIGQLIIMNKFINSEKPDKVEIYYDNKLYQECSITDTKRINLAMFITLYPYMTRG